MDDNTLIINYYNKDEKKDKLLKELDVKIVIFTDIDLYNYIKTLRSNYKTKTFIIIKKKDNDNMEKIKEINPLKSKDFKIWI